MKKCVIGCGRKRTGKLLCRTCYQARLRSSPAIDFEEWIASRARAFERKRWKAKMDEAKAAINHEKLMKTRAELMRRLP